MFYNFQNFEHLKKKKKSVKVKIMPAVKDFIHMTKF